MHTNTANTLLPSGQIERCHETIKTVVQNLKSISVNPSLWFRSYEHVFASLCANPECCMKHSYRNPSQFCSNLRILPNDVGFFKCAFNLAPLGGSNAWKRTSNWLWLRGIATMDSWDSIKAGATVLSTWHAVSSFTAYLSAVIWSRSAHQLPKTLVSQPRYYLHEQHPFAWSRFDNPAAASQRIWWVHSRHSFVHQYVLVNPCAPPSFNLFIYISPCLPVIFSLYSIFPSIALANLCNHVQDPHFVM